MKKNIFRRGFAFLLVMALLAGYIPAINVSAEDAPDLTTTVADPETLTRPEAVYGDNTLNAGKITVGKSVEAAENGSLSVTVNGQTITGDPDNFLVTLTQTAQVMGLTSESSVPLDVVFVLDTSGSMNQGGNNPDRATPMVTAANAAIATLMAANENNRIAVVAFSSTGYGGGSSNNAAANVLSGLDHYTGDAATAHLSWSGDYIQGRSLSNGTRASRNGHDGGTNMQAGIITGANLLTAASNETTVTIDGTTVTRMPFLVVLSDGQPTYTYSDSSWYSPSSTEQQGPGNGDYVGNGFITATTAAYYKSLITEKYYGENASETNRASIYTIGVQISSDLATITLDPASQFVSGSSNNYYDGASGNEDFHTYWTNFTADPAADFTVLVDQEQQGGPGGPGGPGGGQTQTQDVDYTYTAASITATRDRILGKSSTGKTMYTGGLAYNDDYFAADDTEDIADAFTQVISSIQKKALSAPTKVTESGADFSGYVNFYDTIGEYMEVKEMKGIVANGNYYQGRTFTTLLMNPGQNAEFDETLTEMLQTRLHLADSSVSVSSLLSAVRANKELMEDTTNSFCWWGKEYDVGEEDVPMQLLGAAVDDSIEYIESAEAMEEAAKLGAEYVCRSYCYYGTAGNTAQNPNHEYLYFVVRVQRSLVAPYQQTVVVSIPASLLSVEKVSVTEDADGSITAEVEEMDPCRVVYEVGLRSDITPQNVDQIVSETYKNATIGGSTGEPNYYTDSNGNGVYNFYTNEWNRTAVAGTHERALTTATFDVASDNGFYAYQEDTILLVLENGSYVPYTGSQLQAGGTYYYARTYYDWTGASLNSDGTYTATEETAYIAVTIPSGTAAQEHFAKNSQGQWYVKKGTYTASTVVAGDETSKSSNPTGTAANVKYVMNTTDLTNSHYTVRLGNNGRLTLTTDTTKTVSGTRPSNSTITLTDGSTVMVGDELTYTVKVVNNENATATATVTDKIPAGTAYVDGSATQGGSYDAETGIITWNLSGIAANSVEYVSFKVTVTEDALAETVVSVDNTATVTVVTLDNTYTYNTNTTQNPPFGKTVSDPDGDDLPAEGVQVGDVLIYRIRFANDQDTAATITITDVIPEGTQYQNDTASHNGKLLEDGRTLQWVLENVQPHTFGVVTFRVIVDASAKTPVENDAEVQIGENDPVVTNKTQVDVRTGDLTLSKAVVATSGTPATDEFTLLLAEAGGDLTGTYSLSSDSTVGYTQVEFINGEAYMIGATKPGLTIQNGQKLTILDLPAGASIAVAEEEANSLGFTTTYQGLTDNGSVVIPAEADAAVAVTNTYAVASGEFQLTGTKSFVGEMPEELVFSFTSQKCDAQGVVITGEGAVTVTADASVTDPEIIFPRRTFSESGTHYYLITEENAGALGVTYDATKYLLVVHVDDDGSGKLAVSHELFTQDASGAFTVPASSLTFENTYVDPEIRVSLVGKKVLEGRKLNGSEFIFALKDSTGNVIGYGNNDENGDITLPVITYTAADVGKTFTYTVSEETGSLPGITYSTASFTVTVEVKQEGSQLAANVTYPEGGIVFTNEYNTGVTVNLQAEKKITGIRTQLEAGETYSFEVTDASGKVVATGNNDAEGKVVFSDIGYSLDDMDGLSQKTFQYTMKEIAPDMGNPFIQYSAETYTVTVTVEYNSTTGALTVTNVNYGTASNAVPTFTNKVNDNYVTETPASLIKVTEGNNIPEDATFSFSVINAQNNETVGSGSVKAGDGIVTFHPITFTAAGTYQYWIQESSSGTSIHNGIEYDSTRYLWTVEVVYEDSQLKVRSAAYTAYTSGDANDPASYTTAVDMTATHFKNIYNATGMANVTATKVLTGGRTLHANEFDFQLVRVDEPTRVVNGTNDAAGKVTFGSLYYTNEDIPEGQDSATIYYTMSELVHVSNAIPGITFDRTVYYVAVTLTHNSEDTSKIDTTVTYYKTYSDGVYSDPITTAPTFTNDYEAQSTTATIEVGKELSGRQLRDNEFAFELYHVTGEGASQTETLVATATNDKYGKVSFPRHYFAENFPGLPGETVQVRYLIREVKGTLGGVTYSSQVFGVEIPLTDDTAQGKLVAGTPKYYVGTDFTTEAAAPVFNNRYEVQDITVTPTAVKELTGRSLKDNEFNFEVLDENGRLASVGLSKKDGSVSFNSITYTGVGTHEYTITEVKGTMGGIHYDETVYYMVVTVTENSNAGTLEAEVAYYADAAYTQPISAPTFKNTYSTGTATIQLEGTKTLNGRALDASEFSFVVTDEIGNAVTYGSNAAAADGVPAKISFGTITYTSAGQHTYHISELIPSDAANTGITVDTSRFTVVVTVTDDGNGNLTATADYQGTPVAFVNGYSAGAASVTLTAQKYLLNKKLADGEFLFKLSGNGIEKTATNGANGLVTFETLTFTAPGTYTYTVSEVIPQDPNTDITQSFVYGYDKSVYTATVVVTDNGAGQLLASVTYSKDGSNAQAIEFMNSYTPKVITIDLTDTIGADKTLDGRALVAGEFKFEIIDISGNVLSTGTNDAEGNITFTPLTFTTAGIYNYRIQEVLTDLPGAVTGDSRQWRLQVHVRYDETTGLLTIDTENDVHIRDLSNVDVVGNIVFENSYDPAPIDIPISLTKVLEGRDLNAGDFLFQLKYRDVVVEEVRNGGEGHVNFKLSIDRIGTYALTVSEVNEGKDGITYSQDVETVTVSVTDDLPANAPDGILEYHVTYGGDRQFVNSYAPGNGTAVIRVEKLVSIPAGSTYAMKGGEFTFQLLNAVGEEIATATNDGNGYAQFAINYTKDPAQVSDDTFLVTSDDQIFAYTVQEVSGTDAGITYDTTPHKVTVSVKDNLNGQLVTAVEYTDDQAGAVVIENQYDITDVAMVKLPGTKVYVDSNGMPMAIEEGQFTFGLYQDGALVGETVAADADGSFSFVLTYDKDDIGTHEYTVKEISGTDPCVAYDGAVYNVTVTVSDNLAGGLNVTQTITRDGVAENELVFTNVYTEPDPEAVTINIQKLIENNGGQGITPENFEIVLEQNGTETFVLTDADGKASFTVNLTAEDIGKTYEMTVYEKKGTNPCVTYDTTVYDLVIQVEQNADGSLKPIVNGVETNIVALSFTNTYTAPDPEAVTVNIQKLVENNGGQGITAENFEIVLEQKGTETSVLTDADGKASFTVNLTAEDIGKTYEMTVYEKKGTNPCVTYDTTVYDLVIQVEQNADGSLKPIVNGKATNTASFSFTNTYNAPEAQNVVVNVVKTVKSKTEDTIGPENFEIVLSQNGVQKSIKTDKNGKGSFTLTYTAEDIGKTYQVTVSEKKGSVSGVTYDTTVHTLMIQVAQNEDGSLKILINNKEAQSASVSFTNTYAKPSTPATGDSSLIYPMAGVMILSAAGCILLMLLKKKRYQGKYNN